MGSIKRRTTLKWKAAAFHKVLMKKYEEPSTFQPPFIQPFLLSGSAKVLGHRLPPNPSCLRSATVCRVMVLSHQNALRRIHELLEPRLCLGPTDSPAVERGVFIFPELHMLFSCSHQP